MSFESKKALAHIQRLILFHEVAYPPDDEMSDSEAVIALGGWEIVDAHLRSVEKALETEIRMDERWADLRRRFPHEFRDQGDDEVMP